MNPEGNEERGFPFIAIPAREAKPRHQGLTIVSDCGLPLRATVDVLEVAADIIDWVKFTDHAGTVARYPATWIRAKTALYRERGIPAFVGGAVFELAFLHGEGERYLAHLPELGFAAVEISEDLIPPLDARTRRGFLLRARSLGLEVFTEFGRKFPDQAMDLAEAVAAIRSDLEQGARKVAIEESEVLLARENPDGARTLVELVAEVGIESLVFEARTPDIQAWLIRLLGPEVNLENVELSGHQPVVNLERMRVGLHRTAGYWFIAGLATVREERSDAGQGNLTRPG